MSEWKKVPIKDVCVGIYDGPHATPPVSETGGIFLGISNITKDGHFDFSSIKYIGDDYMPKWTKRVTPQKDDIVFSYEATLNLYAVIPDGFYGCLGRRMALIRTNKQLVNHKYLFYYFFSKNWRNLISEKTIVGSTVDRIPIATFPDFEIELPSLDVQNKIATILSRYDSLIENYQKQIKLLEESAQRLYKEWFIDLRFPGHENTKIVDGVPEGWKKKKIFELGKVITGKTPSTANKANYGGDIPFITIPDMHSGIYPISSQTLSKQGAESQLGKYIPENSLMVSCIGTAGLVCISETLCQTNQQINSLVLDNDIKLYYMYFTFLSLKEHLNNIGSNGATMTNVNKSKFENIEVVVPVDSLLDTFNLIANNTFAKIKNLSYQIRHHTEARDRLLPKLMSGEINV